MTPPILPPETETPQMYCLCWTGLTHGWEDNLLYVNFSAASYIKQRTRSWSNEMSHLLIGKNEDISQCTFQAHAASFYHISLTFIVFKEN